MAEQDRDRYGDKMKEVERGKEEDYFARRDRELLEKMRERAAAPCCPTCGSPMQQPVDSPAVCPQCAGG
jgi:hypothetical protein